MGSWREADRLGNHHHTARGRRERLSDSVGDGPVKHCDRRRPVQDVPDRRRGVRLDEIVVHVGAGQRDDVGHAQLPRHRRRQRSGAQRVERVDETGWRGDDVTLNGLRARP